MYFIKINLEFCQKYFRFDLYQDFSLYINIIRDRIDKIKKDYRIIEEIALITLKEFHN